MAQPPDLVAEGQPVAPDGERNQQHRQPPGDDAGAQARRAEHPVDLRHRIQGIRPEAGRRIEQRMQDDRAEDHPPRDLMEAHRPVDAGTARDALEPPGEDELSEHHHIGHHDEPAGEFAEQVARLMAMDQGQDEGHDEGQETQAGIACDQRRRREPARLNLRTRQRNGTRLRRHAWLSGWRRGPVIAANGHRGIVPDRTAIVPAAIRYRSCSNHRMVRGYVVPASRQRAGTRPLDA